MSCRPWCLCLLLATLPGCGDDDGGHQNPTCPEGHAPRGPACVPIFDECPGSAEIPVLGGGCLAVGVTACATGFASDGAGGCDAILPSGPCPPGTMEVLGQTTCQPVGVTACATGFASDGAGGCDAVLPPGPCPTGTLEVLGETSCQPLGDCGDGPWGLVAIDGTTVFVDAAADASGADGTEAHPYPSLEDGVAAAPDGGQVAIAGGDYPVRLRVSRPVRLAGRCAAAVTLRGRLDEGAVRAPLTVYAGGSGTTVQGITLTGDATGLQLSEATDVSLHDVQIVDTGGPGLLAVRSGMTLDRVVVARATEFAVVGTAVDARVSRSVLRDTRPSTSGARGFGLGATCDGDGPACSRVMLEGSVLSDNRSAGVIVFGTDLALTGTVIRRTAPATDGGFGRGLEAICEADGLGCGQVSVSGSLIAENHDLGLSIFGVDAVVTDTVIRDTAPSGSGASGVGVYTECDTDTAACPALDLRHSVVSGNTLAGVSSLGGRATLVGVAVRDTLPGAGPGRGIEAACLPGQEVCGPVVVQDSLLADNTTAGLGVRGRSATVTGCVIRGTLAPADAPWGRGLEAFCNGETATCGDLAVSSTLITGNHGFGIVLMGPAATITGTVVQDTLPGSDGGRGRGLEAVCDAGIPACGPVTLIGSLLARNQEAGVSLWGVPTTVRDTVVRDTTASPGEGRGHGLSVLCDPVAQVCGPLEVTSSVIERSTELGMLIEASEAEVTGTVIRDTRPAATDGVARGLEVHCDADLQVCGRLVLVDSLISGGTDLGLYLVGTPASLVGTTVRDLQPTGAASDSPPSGQGIFVRCDPDGLRCGSFEMTACSVRSTYTTGLALLGVSGVLRSSEVTQVWPRADDDRFGYGIQISGLPDAALPALDVLTSRIQDADLAGIVFGGAAGSVSGCTIGGGDFSIAMSPGSTPTIAENNLLEGSVSSEPAWVSLAVTPSPPPIVSE